MKASSKSYPRSTYNAGPYHGSGIPGKIGKRKGTFTNDRPSNPKMNSKPPRKTA